LDIPLHSQRSLKNRSSFFRLEWSFDLEILFHSGLKHGAVVFVDPKSLDLLISKFIQKFPTGFILITMFEKDAGKSLQER
jgi:hypothetical protein